MRLVLNPKYISVELIEENIQHSSGLILNKGNKDINKYRVVNAPDINVSTFNTLLTGDIKVGDIIYVNASLVNEVDLSGTKYYFTNISDVLAIIVE